MNRRLFWRYINLLITSTFVGNELGAAIGVQPALARLPTPLQIQAEHAIVHRYLRMMPLWVTACLLSYLPVLRHLAQRRTWPLYATRASLGCMLAMLGITFMTNLPLDLRMRDLSPATPPAHWQHIRTRWMRWHWLRNGLNLAALVLLYSGVLADS